MAMNKYKFLSLVLLSSVVASPAYAADIGSMFASFTSSAQEISKLINVAAYIIGIYLIINSIFKFTKINQQGGSLKGAVVMFACGCSLFSITGAISIALETASLGATPGAGDILAPASTGGMPAAMVAAMTGVLTFIKMIGYIAFVRGWLLLNAAGNGKEGALFRGLTHIFGGVAAINVTITAKIIANTIAPGLTIPGIT